MANLRHRLNSNSGKKVSIITRKRRNLTPQAVSECSGIGREKHPSLRMPAYLMKHPMDCHNRFAGSRKARHAHRPCVATFHQLALRRMEEYGAFLPCVVESPTQLADIVENTETALGVRVSRGIDFYRRGLPPRGLFAHGELEKRFLRLLRQMLDKIEERVFIGAMDVIDPAFGNAERR